MLGMTSKLANILCCGNCVRDKPKDNVLSTTDENHLPIDTRDHIDFRDARKPPDARDTDGARATRVSRDTRERQDNRDIRVRYTHGSSLDDDRNIEKLEEDSEVTFMLTEEDSAYDTGSGAQGKDQRVTERKHDAFNNSSSNVTDDVTDDVKEEGDTTDDVRREEDATDEVTGEEDVPEDVEASPSEPMVMEHLKRRESEIPLTNSKEFHDHYNWKSRISSHHVVRKLQPRTSLTSSTSAREASREWKRLLPDPEQEALFEDVQHPFHEDMQQDLQKHAEQDLHEDVKQNLQEPVQQHPQEDVPKSTENGHVSRKSEDLWDPKTSVEDAEVEATLDISNVRKSILQLERRTSSISPPPTIYLKSGRKGIPTPPPLPVPSRKKTSRIAPQWPLGKLRMRGICLQQPLVQEQVESTMSPLITGEVPKSISQASVSSEAESLEDTKRMNVDEIFQRFQGRSIPVQALVSYFEDVHSTKAETAKSKVDLNLDP